MGFSDKEKKCSRRFIKSLRDHSCLIIRQLKAPHTVVKQVYSEYEFYKGLYRRYPYEMHAPDRWDIFSYAVGRYTDEMLKVCSFWIVGQFAVGVWWDIIGAWLHSCSLFLPVAKPLLLFALFTDAGIFCLLVVIIAANVTMYGPTSVSFVVALRSDPEWGELERLARRNYPRLSDPPEMQMVKWENVRTLINKIARQASGIPSYFMT